MVDELSTLSSQQMANKEGDTVELVLTTTSIK